MSRPRTTGETFDKLSVAAKKGWQTRKNNDKQRKLSQASKRGWITRRAKAQYGDSSLVNRLQDYCS